jgi:hypothetical protein
MGKWPFWEHLLKVKKDDIIVHKYAFLLVDSRYTPFSGKTKADLKGLVPDRAAA